MLDADFNWRFRLGSRLRNLYRFFNELFVLYLCLGLCCLLCCGLFNFLFFLLNLFFYRGFLCLFSLGLLVVGIVN